MSATTHEKAQRKPRPGSVEAWGQERYEAGKAEAQAQVAELTAQRDALLEACKLAEENLAPVYCSYHLVMRKLRGAIAQATGNSQ